MRFIVAIALLAAFLAASLRWLPVPWLWPILVSSVLLLTQVRFRDKSARTLFCWNVGVVLLLLAVGEAWLATADVLEAREAGRIRRRQVYVTSDDPVLGYVLKPNTRRRAAKYYDAETVYDVTCTVDADGLRVSPPSRTDCTSSVLFFGCSNTYGEGVNDEQTMPYRVGVLTDGHFRIYNFGLHGYGPQHMLAMIEAGRVQSIVKEPPQHAIYQALYPSHAYRAAGKRAWVRTGPRYTIDSSGAPVRHGSFSDSDWRSPVWLWLRSQIDKSSLGRRLLSLPGRLTAADERRFLAIVKASADLLEQEYPSVQFHVLIWTSDRSIIQRLSDKGMDVHDVGGFAATARRQEGSASLHPADPHPTPLVYTLIARYVIESIIGYQQETEQPTERDK